MKRGLHNYEPQSFTEVIIPASFEAIDLKESVAALPMGTFAEHTGSYYLAQSSDKNFLIMAWFQPIKTVADSIDLYESTTVELLRAMYECEGESVSSIPPRNAMHIPRIESDLGQTLGKTQRNITKSDYKDHVHYFSDDYARSKFNADSVAVYNYWPKGEKVFKAYCLSDNKLKVKIKENFIGSRVFMIQKEEISFVIIYCFYTEEGKCRIDETMKEIEGIVRFKD